MKNDSNQFPGDSCFESSKMVHAF